MRMAFKETRPLTNEEFDALYAKYSDETYGDGVDYPNWSDAAFSALMNYAQQLRTPPLTLPTGKVVTKEIVSRAVKSVYDEFPAIRQCMHESQLIRLLYEALKEK